MSALVSIWWKQVLSRLAEVWRRLFVNRSKTSQRELYEFLPAAIEIERTPASPVGRAMAWVIVLLFLSALVWACLGRSDIVAVAQGKIIPSEHIKHIQALETAQIKAINVREGQFVDAGDVLIDLDATHAKADAERIKAELVELGMSIGRLRQFAFWLREYGEDPALNIKLDQTALDETQQKLLFQQRSEVKGRLDKLEAEKLTVLAELEMTEAQAEKHRRLIPVLQERADARQRLYEKNYGARLPFLELTQSLIEEEQGLKVQKARAVQLESSLLSIDKQMLSVLSEQRLSALSQLQEYSARYRSLQQELIKARQRIKQQVLRAPIAGRVQELAVHTVGGVVTPAQVLMVIVPEVRDLEVEVMLKNQDIGFIAEGQSAEVKVDTFNFTKYGLVAATVVSISDDAIQDESSGLVYKARLKLHTQHLQIDGQQMQLAPGMTVSAELKTGKRRLIEYFLSPLLRYKQESLGER